MADGDVPGVVELLTELRAHRPLLPLLLVADPAQRATVNQAQLLRAECLFHPATGRDVRAFLRRATRFRRLGPEQLGARLQHVAQSHGLTERETELVAAELAGRPRAELLARFGISANTLKTQVRGVLRKTGFDSMGALARGMLREALAATDAMRPSQPPPSH